METIFHEKQEGSLCAQHCLNALLQGEYFTAVDLATIAQNIDEEERRRMAEGGVLSEDYHKFLQQPSGNMDDSGYFSVQVIASALKVWCLDLVPYKSQDVIAQAAQKDPTMQRAYICNYKDHWLTIRKLGNQWFNLNSLLTGPELISNTYLSLFLAQLQNEGYSIFIVTGILPHCESDDFLRRKPAVQHEKPPLISEVQNTKAGQSSGKQEGQSEEDASLKQILKQSLESSKEAEDARLQAVLSMSLHEYESTNSQKEEESRPSCSTSPSTSFFMQQQSSSISRDLESMSEQEMLETALKMSLETS